MAFAETGCITNLRAIRQGLRLKSDYQFVRQVANRLRIMRHIQESEENMDMPRLFETGCV